MEAEEEKPEEGDLDQAMSILKAALIAERMGKNRNNSSETHREL